MCIVLPIDSRGVQRRSTCPVNYAVELFGDHWSLLIIRDLLFNGKQTFGEFLESPEGIARNILAARLKTLENSALIDKRPYPGDGRKDLYSLTEKGQRLLPVLVALSDWSFATEPMTLVHKS